MFVFFLFDGQMDIWISSVIGTTWCMKQNSFWTFFSRQSPRRDLLIKRPNLPFSISDGRIITGAPPDSPSFSVQRLGSKWVAGVVEEMKAKVSVKQIRPLWIAEKPAFKKRPSAVIWANDANEKPLMSSCIVSVSALILTNPAVAKHFSSFFFFFFFKQYPWWMRWSFIIRVAG